jgi:hypothetical protein
MRCCDCAVTVLWWLRCCADALLSAAVGCALRCAAGWLAVAGWLLLRCAGALRCAVAMAVLAGCAGWLCWLCWLAVAENPYESKT